MSSSGRRTPSLQTEATARLVRRVASTALAAASMAVPTGAADVVFRPSLSFGLFHDGNIDIVGTSKGDDAGEISLDLVLDRLTPRSKLTFAYRPSYRRYRTATDLDYFANTVVLSYAHQKSRRTKTAASFDASRTETQGIQDYSTDRPVTFVPRTTTYRVAGGVGGTVGMARRSLVDWGARIQGDSYQSSGSTQYDNSGAIGVLGGWRFEASQKSTIGLALRVDWFVYEQNSANSVPNVVTETFGITGTQVIARTTDMSYGAGASLSASSGSTKTNPWFLITVANKLSERTTINAGAKQAVGTGTGIGGGSLDRGAWLGYARSAQKRGVSASIYGSYWFRQSLELAQQGSGEVRTADVTGTVGWTFSRYLALTAAYSYVDQHSPTATVSSSDTSYSSYGVFLRWAMRGR